jgi:hypothetical protein
MAGFGLPEYHANVFIWITWAWWFLHAVMWALEEKTLRERVVELEKQLEG